MLFYVEIGSYFLKASEELRRVEFEDIKTWMKFNGINCSTHFITQNPRLSSAQSLSQVSKMGKLFETDFMVC
jgi:hypothetical protein